MGVLLLSIDTILIDLTCITLGHSICVTVAAAALSGESPLEVGSIFGSANVEL